MQGTFSQAPTEPNPDSSDAVAPIAEDVDKAYPDYRALVGCLAELSKVGPRGRARLLTLSVLHRTERHPFVLREGRDPTFCLMFEAAKLRFEGTHAAIAFARRLIGLNESVLRDVRRSSTRHAGTPRAALASRLAHRCIERSQRLRRWAEYCRLQSFSNCSAASGEILIQSDDSNAFWWKLLHLRFRAEDMLAYAELVRDCLLIEASHFGSEAAKVQAHCEADVLIGLGFSEAAAILRSISFDEPIGHLAPAPTTSNVDSEPRMTHSARREGGRQTGAVERACAVLEAALERDQRPWDSIEALARAVRCHSSTLRDSDALKSKWANYSAYLQAEKLERCDRDAGRLLEHHPPEKG